MWAGTTRIPVSLLIYPCSIFFQKKRKRKTKANKNKNNSKTKKNCIFLSVLQNGVSTWHSTGQWDTSGSLLTTSEQSQLCSFLSFPFHLPRTQTYSWRCIRCLVTVKWPRREKPHTKNGETERRKRAWRLRTLGKLRTHSWPDPPGLIRRRNTCLTEVSNCGFCCTQMGRIPVTTKGIIDRATV